MGPPREHGGMLLLGGAPPDPVSKLQWGRRVNTAEWTPRCNFCDAVCTASMGPPREHGGMELQLDLRVREEAASMGPPREHGGMVV